MKTVCGTARNLVSFAHRTAALWTHPQDFLSMSIKDVCGEGPVRPEPLPAHGFPQSAVMLCHIADMISIWV